jgi:hypothetical protein
MQEFKGEYLGNEYYSRRISTNQRNGVNALKFAQGYGGSHRGNIKPLGVLDLALQDSERDLSV